MCAEVSLYVDIYEELEVYDMIQEGFCVYLCAEVSSYVDVYNELEV